MCIPHGTMSLKRKKGDFLIPFLNRREFLLYSFATSAVFITNGCEVNGITTPLETLSQVQKDLFPKSKTLGINTQHYMRIVLNHPRIDDKTKTFLKNSVAWLNESAYERYQKKYILLNDEHRQKLLHQISTTQWGERWIYKLLSFGFEAMLGDPVYGANINEAGWRWLKFEGGRPRPKKAYL